MHAKTHYHRPPAWGFGQSASIFAVALLMLTLIIPVSATSGEPQYIEISDETSDNSHYALKSSYAFSTYNVQKFKQERQGLALLIHRDIGDITRIIFGSSSILTTSPDRIDQTSVDFYYNPTDYSSTIDRTHYVGSGTIYVYSNSETNEGHMSFIMDNWDSSVYASHPDEQVYCHADLSRNLNFSTIKLRKLPNNCYIGMDGNVAGLDAVAGSTMTLGTGDPTYVYTKGDEFRQKITYYNINNDFNAVEVSRLADDTFYQSTVTVSSRQKTEPYYVDDTNSNTVVSWFPTNETPYDISIYSPLTTKTYNYTVFDGDSPTPTPTGDNLSVTVYIRNSQTGAAIANSHCVIDALVDGDYYPVVNRTEPSGVFSVTLQPTGGGRPNPDGYRLIASADGYNNPMPEINFTVDEYTTSIYCYLDPIAGGPLNENNTFIDFFVRDMSANPISGATVKFGDYTLLTNSQGYTVFEVGKNATYTYTVSKSGYGSLMGNAVIGANPRHTINTVLAPALTPTTPTSIPTSTPISPTPTMTAPTGEPVSNWLDWFAAHFGMILGGGVEIGKIFMWLCFAVPVGVYVGKEAKAGAAGFMAGAGIVTIFFVLIGWVPIWLLVLLALIIGLLYAKVFNSSDTGGGR